MLGEKLIASGLSSVWEVAMAEAVTIEPPRPAPDALTQPFWDGVTEGRLLIQRCNSCGHYIHYPRPVCRFCRSTDLAWSEVSGRGTIYSYTVTVQPFHPFWADRTPYVVATIELAEQAHLHFLSNIVDVEESEISVGMPVAVTFQEIAPGLTLPLFTRKQAS
jgi:uncharacterized protein